MKKSEWLNSTVFWYAARMANESIGEQYVCIEAATLESINISRTATKYPTQMRFVLAEDQAKNMVK